MRNPARYLDDKGLIELTGRVQRKKQIDNLIENGIGFTVDANGRAKVPVDYLDRLHSGISSNDEVPDFEALNYG